MQSIGGCRTSSQQYQFQEPSRPQHSRTHKLYFQSPSCVRAPVPKNAPAYCARSGGSDQKQREKTKRKGCCKCHPCGEAKPELRVSWKCPFFGCVEIAKAAQGHQ